MNPVFQSNGGQMNLPIRTASIPPEFPPLNSPMMDLLPMALGPVFRTLPLTAIPWLLAAAPVTFHKDVEPILQARCQNCHRPQEAAPMSLLTYEQARPWAKAIRAAVLSGKMPPWQADPRYGHFSNDLSLAPGERETLVAWADGGALQGKASDAPRPRVFPQGWRIPKPDMVFEMPEDFSVPAQGAVDYQYISVPTHFTEDRWVEVAEVRPGNRSIVHHAIVMVDELGDGRGQEYLAGYAPGMMPQIWKPGQARLVRAGSSLVFQMHYTTNGKAGTDRTRIGLIFSKNPPAERITSMEAMAPWLEIPAGEAHYRIESTVLMSEPTRLMGIRPHMHLRGKSFQVRAVYPGGQTQILLDVPKFNFDYQPYYYLETPKLLPKGTRIECYAVYDNSASNPRNPDPSATVLWGPQTWDEMMIGWLDVGFPATGGWSRRGELTPVE
jgi:hypothetical protein